MDNIVNDSISYSLIASFNDNFDSTISYGDVKKRAKEQHDAKSTLANQFGLSYPIGKQKWTEILIEEQKLHSDFLHDNYCLCLSENNSSVLMWSHYADNHKGICIEYDFESIKNNKLIYYSLFPVNYTAKPIDIYDLVNSEKKYYIEIGLMISLLNKSISWNYEQEWRSTLLDLSVINKRPSEVYINLNNDIIPAKRIILGHNFLDNFIKELSNEKIYNDAIDNFEKLFQHIKNKTPVSIMIPIQDSFEIMPITVKNSDVIYNFIKKQIYNKSLTLSNRSSVYNNFFDLLAQQY